MTFSTPSRIESLAAIVLAGGESQRMGEPKALLRFGDVTLVERVTERLGRACARVVVVAQAALMLPRLPPEVLVLRDPLPDAGPLVGLSAGLDALDASTPWAFVCAGPSISIPSIRALDHISDAERYMEPCSSWART